MNPFTTHRTSLTPVDSAWLHMEKPTSMAMITSVLLFDEPLDFARLQAMITERVLPFKRFRERIHERTLSLGTPEWELDPSFTLAAHLHHTRLPAPGDRAALQQLVGELMSTPLDFSKPLWDMHLVENVGKGCALIGRFHHCMGDGFALVHVLYSMTDSESNATEPKTAAEPSPTLWRSLLKPAIRTIDSTVHATDTLVHAGVKTLLHPSHLTDAARVGARGALTLGDLLLLAPDPPTMLKGECGVTKYAAWSKPVPLARVKTVAHALGVTVNDLLLASVAGALRRYLLRRNEPTTELEIRAVVPVNLRPLTDLENCELGNRFGLVFVELPLGIAKPLERLTAVKERIDEIKGSPEAVVTFGILTTMGILPIQLQNIITKIFATKGTLVMTNVPGPRQVLYMVGKPIRGMMFWVPSPGDLGIGVSILSYAGQVELGVQTDADMVPDPDAIVAEFHTEFAAMERLSHRLHKTRAGKLRPRASHKSVKHPIKD